MRKLSAIIITAGILSLLCLMISYQEKWLLSTSVLLTLGIVIVLFRKHSAFWLPTVYFSTYTGFAIWYLLQQVSPFLIISGELFVFLTWELLVFKNGLAGNLQAPELNLLIEFHIRKLIPVMLIAWLLCIILFNIHFKLPFLVILLFGSLGIFGFIRFYTKARHF